MATARKTTTPTSTPSRSLPSSFNILGLDPGTNSFAYSVLNVRHTKTGKLTLKVLQHGMVHSTMRDLRYPRLLYQQLLSYKECVLALTSRFDVKAVIAERYMLRRGSGGTAIESINLMLGILLDLGYPTKLTPAVQWKNAMKRLGVDLDGLYLEGKPLKVTPHQIDATHIACFGAMTLTGLTAPLGGVLPQLQAKAKVDIGTSTKKDTENFLGVKKRPRKRKAKP